MKKFSINIGHKCDLDAYYFLKKCSEKKDFSEWNKWRDKNDGRELFLQGVDFKNFYFEDAYLTEINFENAVFSHAQCKNASFIRAKLLNTDFCASDCRRACFLGANCENTNFTFANCEKTSFMYCDFSNKTLFSFIEMDNDTCFLYSDYSIAKVSPDIKSKIEQNIRRECWEQWYRRPSTNRKSKYPLLRILCTSPIRLFWHISDYGCSTRRILLYFFLEIIVFTLLYMLIPDIIAHNGNVISIKKDTNCLIFFIKMFLFAMSTMVTLGFSNINVAGIDSPNTLGMIIVALNLLVGYTMLAIWVTRLSILFQTLGPEYKNVTNLITGKG